MAKLLKLRRGTTSQHSSFTGAEGEVTVDTTKDTLVVHDGSTAGGIPLAKESGNIATATLGTNVTVTANNSTDETVYPVFVDGATGTQGIESDTGLTYNPSSGNLTIGGELDAATGDFSGNVDIDGNVDVDGTLEADAITVNGTALNTVIAGVTVTNATNAVTATNANHVSVSDNESTNENNLIPFIEDASATGNVGLESDGDFHYNPSSGQLTVPAVSTSGNVTVAGNLTVNGTTTTVATTNTTITDNLLELNSGAGSNANDCGILIERGSTGNNAIIAWDESADKFTVGTTTGTASSTGNISITTGTLVANIEGNLDGLSSGSFVRSDADDTVANHLTFTDSDAYPVDINNSHDAKIVLRGSNNPYIRWREGNTDKAYIQWNVGGFLEIYNQEATKSLQLGSNLTFDSNTVWHAGNDGSGSGLDADTVDGIQASSFLRSDAADTASGDITFNGGTGAITVGSNGDIRFTGDGGAWTGNITTAKIQAHSNYLYICGGTSGIIFRENGDNRWAIDGNGNFNPGSDSTYNIGSTSVRVAHGYFDNISDGKGNVRQIPNNHTTSAYTLVAADSGKVVTNTSGGVNVPYNVFGVGDTITIINQSGSDITITQGSNNTMYNTADASTGNRTLAGRGMATVWYKVHNECYISGSGLS